MVNDRRQKNITRDRLDDIANHYRRWALISLGFLASMVILFVLTIIGGMYLLNQHRHQTNLIQEQRRELLIQACEDQNERHDKTVNKINALYKVNSRYLSPIQAEALSKSRANAIIIIDTLAPKRNCISVADKYT